MPRKRLTKQQINEGLDQVPVTEILLGNSRAHGVKLTAKQMKFAEELAKGETKAGAYRKAYNTKAKPQVQSIEGQKLSKNPAVAMQVEAIRVALEAEKYATPLHLRALVIQRLTEKALDPEVNHAQQLRALELLGKVTEIAAFTERRETVHVHDSTSARDKLLHSIRMAINAEATDVDAVDADSLLAELAPPPAQIQPTETPPPTDPPILNDVGAETTHSIPHTQSTPIDASLTPVKDSSVSLTNVKDSLSLTPVKDDLSLTNVKDRGEGVEEIEPIINKC